MRRRHKKPKPRSPMAPPGFRMGDERKEQDRRRCRGRVELDEDGELLDDRRSSLHRPVTGRSLAPVGQADMRPRLPGGAFPVRREGPQRQEGAGAGLVTDERPPGYIVGQTKEKLGPTKEKFGQTNEKFGQTKEIVGPTNEKLGPTKLFVGPTKEILGQTKESAEA